MPSETLSRLAVRISDADYDPRHAILDVSRELLARDAEADVLPPRLAAELRELLAEVRLVQPNYPSRRETSALFDRAGLGRPGYERAERIVRRLVGLARTVERMKIEERG